MSSPLGATGAGTSWALKALHPSDPLTMVEGIPDEATHCSTGLNYQQLTNIAPPAGIGASNWDCTILFSSDPTVFATYYALSQSDANIRTLTCVTNEALAPAGRVREAVDSFVSDFSHWRLMYGGLSVHLSAPATADQGTVVAAQYPIRHLEMGAQSYLETDELVPVVTRFPVCRFNQSEVLPEYDTLVKMPNAMTGLAKEGIYMPMKLQSNHQQWHTREDRRYDASVWPVDDAHPAQYLVPMVQHLGTAWPYVTTEQLQVGEADSFVGDYHLLPCNDYVGGICFKGLSSAATLQLTFRMGFEARCLPSSQFTSFLKVSPEHDLMAISNYYKIARQLKDAYPVEYNDLGKLWDVIKGAARVISPVLGLIPGGGIIRGVAGAVGKVGDAIAASRKKDAPVSAVELQEAQEDTRRAIDDKARRAVVKRVASRKPLKARR